MCLRTSRSIRVAAERANDRSHRALTADPLHSEHRRAAYRANVGRSLTGGEPRPRSSSARLWDISLNSHPHGARQPSFAPRARGGSASLKDGDMFLSEVPRNPALFSRASSLIHPRMQHAIISVTGAALFRGVSRSIRVARARGHVRSHGRALADPIKRRCMDAPGELAGDDARKRRRQRWIGNIRVGHRRLLGRCKSVNPA